MIAFFPEIYPDELVYSLLARYYVKTGYLTLRSVLEELYVHPYTVPDIEFINELKPETVELLDRLCDMETLIQKHTMFASYGRFLPGERKRMAYEALLEMHGNFNNLLSVSKNQRGVGKFLRYCPVCAKEDRERYGETYWHREHQIQKLRICGKHRCTLKESEVSMNRKTSPGLWDAESIVPVKESPVLCQDGRETALGEYVCQVFRAEIQFEGKASVADLLKLRLKEYQRSDSGVSLSFENIYRDYREYYGAECSMSESGMQKVLNGVRYDFYDICQLAMFAGVTPGELTEIPDSVSDELRNPVFVQVAEELGLDYELVSRVGEAVLKREGQVCVQRKKRGLAWNRMDEELLPEVTAAIVRLRGNGMERPRRVTVSAVTRELHLPCKRFDRLPQCRAEILRCQTSQKEYWAEEAVWAYRKLIREGQPVSWRKIRVLTNIRPEDFRGCKPYLPVYADAREAEVLSGLI